MMMLRPRCLVCNFLIDHINAVMLRPRCLVYDCLIDHIQCEDAEAALLGMQLPHRPHKM